MFSVIRTGSVTLTLLLMVTAGACQGERATKVKIEGDKTPRFVLTGNGNLTVLRIYGPWDKYAPDGIVWEIRPEEQDLDKVETVEEVGTVVYGQTPKGYRQSYPKEGQAPSLEEGIDYKIFVGTVNAPTALRTFAIRNNKAIDTTPADEQRR